MDYRDDPEYVKSAIRNCREAMNQETVPEYKAEWRNALDCYLEDAERLGIDAK